MMKERDPGKEGWGGWQHMRQREPPERSSRRALGQKSRGIQTSCSGETPWHWRWRVKQEQNIPRDDFDWMELACFLRRVLGLNSQGIIVGRLGEMHAKGYIYSLPAYRRRSLHSAPTWTEHWVWSFGSGSGRWLGTFFMVDNVIPHSFSCSFFIFIL